LSEISNFSEIEAEFMKRVSRIVWCTVTSVDRRDRPRARILHPVWEGSTGWIATGRQSFKAKHIAHNPHLSLSYWDPAHEQVHAECHAEWEDDPAEKARLWEFYKATPPPLGYDLAMFWQDAEDPAYGLLRLSPWRIEISALADMMKGRAPEVWRP
jgi:general stress protein 26